MPTVKVLCSTCDGVGCDACHKGRVQGFCACKMPGDVLAGPTPLCYACASICGVCDEGVAVDDRVPLDGSFAHVTCVLALAPRFLETAEIRVDSDGHAEAAVGGPRRASRRSATMPKLTIKTDSLMRRRGLISVADASRIVGVNKSTLYERLRKGTIGPPERAGVFVYVPLRSLIAVYPCVTELQSLLAEFEAQQVRAA